MGTKTISTDHDYTPVVFTLHLYEDEAWNFTETDRSKVSPHNQLSVTLLYLKSEGLTYGNILWRNI